MNNEDDIFFLEEDENTQETATTDGPSCWKVMVVDDDNEIHSVTKLVLAGFKFQGHPLKIIDVYSGAEAIKAIQENPDTALMLLDIVMESEHAGLKVVKAVRDDIKNDLVRIVLRTGQPGQAPEKDIIEQYDINDYKDKTELTSQKLVTLLYSALRSYADILEVNRKKQEAEIFHNETVTKLEASKKHIFNIIDAMPSILICVKDDMTVTDWNRQATELTHLTISEVIGKNVMDVFPHAKHIKQLIENTIAEKNQQVAEKVMLAFDKQQHYYYVATYPISIADSVGAVIRMDDISSQVMKDSMMVKSEKMAMIGQLAAGMAYEIRNPIGLIIQNSQNITSRLDEENSKNKQTAEEIGFSFEKLKKYLDERKISKFIKNIREAADSAMELVNNMLGFGFDDNGEMQYLPINTIINDSINLIKKDAEVIKKYDIEKNPIETHIAEDLPDLPCIKSQLVQAFFNIIKYCIHDTIGHTEYPRVVISVFLDQEDISFVIKDNGKGLEKEAAEKLFDIDNGLCKNNATQSNFGLSVCKYIIQEQHHGKVEVDTTITQGLCIKILLPKVLKVSRLRNQQ